MHIIIKPEDPVKQIQSQALVYLKENMKQYNIAKNNVPTRKVYVACRFLYIAT